MRTELNVWEFRAESNSGRGLPVPTSPQTRPSPALGPAGAMYTLPSLWTTSILLLCTLSISSVRALHESEAGVVDWQKTFIGVPRADRPQVAPSFLRVRGRGNDTKSLIISTTETTLGAVNPADGSVGELNRSDDASPLDVSFCRLAQTSRPV